MSRAIISALERRDDIAPRIPSELFNTVIMTMLSVIEYHASDRLFTFACVKLFRESTYSK